MIKHISIGMNSCGIAAGAEEIKSFLLDQLKELKIDVIENHYLILSLKIPFILMVT